MRPLLLALALLALTAGEASAHAELIGSDPVSGATVSTPTTLTASFSEPLGTDRSRIVVRNAAGDEVARGGISADDETVMTVELPALPPGSYSARWTAVTPEDGGVTRGTITFTVSALPASPGTSPAATPAGSPAASPTERPGGLPVLTPVPGTTPRPIPTATAAPPATPTPAVTAPPTAGPTLAVSPSPAPTAGSGNDLLIALVLATVIVGGLALLLLRR